MPWRYACRRPCAVIGESERDTQNNDCGADELQEGGQWMPRKIMGKRTESAPNTEEIAGVTGSCKM
jgi:hypothetical protein